MLSGWCLNAHFSGFEREEKRKCLFSALKSLLTCTNALFNAMFSKIKDVCLVDKDRSFGLTGSVGPITNYVPVSFQSGRTLLNKVPLGTCTRRSVAVRSPDKWN